MINRCYGAEHRDIVQIEFTEQIQAGFLRQWEETSQEEQYPTAEDGIL